MAFFSWMCTILLSHAIGEVVENAEGTTLLQAEANEFGLDVGTDMQEANEFELENWEWGCDTIFKDLLNIPDQEEGVLYVKLSQDGQQIHKHETRRGKTILGMGGDETTYFKAEFVEPPPGDGLYFQNKRFSTYHLTRNDLGMGMYLRAATRVPPVGDWEDGPYVRCPDHDCTQTGTCHQQEEWLPLELRGDDQETATLFLCRRAKSQKVKRPMSEFMLIKPNGPQINYGGFGTENWPNLVSYLSSTFYQHSLSCFEQFPHKQPLEHHPEADQPTRRKKSSFAIEAPE